MSMPEQPMREPAPDAFERIAQHPDNQDLAQLGQGSAPTPHPGTLEEDFAFSAHPDIADLNQRRYPLLRRGEGLRRLAREAEARRRDGSHLGQPVQEQGPETSNTHVMRAEADDLSMAALRAAYQEHRNRPMQRLRRLGRTVLSAISRQGR